jgi:hypothetical protein
MSGKFAKLGRQALRVLRRENNFRMTNDEALMSKQ